MPKHLARLVLVCAAGAAGTLPAAASSTAASSASDSIGATVGSVSDSVQGSSNASSGRRQDTAEGPYRITEVAAVAGRPLHVQLTLVPTQRGEPVQLQLPRETVRQARLGAGDEVVARQRPYGVEFSAGEPRAAFFLVLHDDWHGDLAARPVPL